MVLDLNYLVGIYLGRWRGQHYEDLSDHPEYGYSDSNGDEYVAHESQRTRKSLFVLRASR